MLTIRSEQMQAFQTARRKALPPGIIAFLLERAPADSGRISRAALATLVDSALANAATLALNIEWDLYRFCWLELLHGPRFHENKVWARLIIAEPAPTPTEMMDRLEQYCLNYPPVDPAQLAGSDASTNPLDLGV